MASVKFLLNRPKSDKPTSILVRFHSKQTKSVTLSTGEYCHPDHWDGNRVTSKHRKQYDRINKHLTTIEGQILDLWRDNKSASGEALKALITTVVKGKDEQDEKKTFIPVVKLFIAQYEQEKEKATITKYRTVLHKLEAFNPNLTFSDLDQNFYDEFKKWLYGNDNPVYAGYDLRSDPDGDGYILVACDSPAVRVGLFDDVVFKYITNIQTIIHWAEKRGYQVNPSYKDWEIIKREYPVISLTLDELQKIEALSMLPQHLSIARDYLSICCRSGQRISDVKRISSLAISSGTWHVYQKKGSRQKQKIVELSLKGFCAPVIDIVSKYGGQLPALSEQHINKHIKTLCKLAGIDQEIYIERWQGNKKIRIPGKKYEFISCHSGKRTFVTILGGFGVPVKVISDLTGTSIRTIERHYLGKTDMHIIDSYLMKIESPETKKIAI
jgi:hypothetical protein